VTVNQCAFEEGSTLSHFGGLFEAFGRRKAIHPGKQRFEQPARLHLEGDGEAS